MLEKPKPPCKECEYIDPEDICHFYLTKLDCHNYRKNYPIYQAQLQTQKETAREIVEWLKKESSRNKAHRKDVSAYSMALQLEQLMKEKGIGGSSSLYTFFTQPG